MTAICPKNPEHKKFITQAQVYEDWVVNGDGNYIATASQGEISKYPDTDNSWTCSECGAEANHI